jgi:hypothetical protein
LRAISSGHHALFPETVIRKEYQEAPRIVVKHQSCGIGLALTLGPHCQRSLLSSRLRNNAFDTTASFRIIDINYL